MDVREGLDHVVAELGVHRLRDLAGLQRERGLVELRNRLAPHDRQLAALVLRARVGRVFLGEGGEVGLRLQARRRRPAELRVDRVRKRLLLHQDVRDVDQGEAGPLPAVPRAELETDGTWVRRSVSWNGARSLDPRPTVG